MKKDTSKRNLTLAFILVVAIVLTITIAILMVVNYIFIYFNIININDTDFQAWLYLLVAILSSVLIGVGLSAIASRFFIQPINKLINGLVDLSHGLYSIRLDLGKYAMMKTLSESFNSLAKELENNEFVHNDFINSFSHEFKTPISSINMLINLLKNKKLSEEKKIEYLSIIEEEAERLLSLTSNILMLSKVDNKAVLNNVTNYNISEQIRNCILLYEKKWERKNLSLSLDFDEFNIYANEDLMKQVWINLIDNSIKFSNPSTELKITINKDNKFIFIAVDNVGVTINEDQIEKIFNKFYQIDSTHSKEGNGIGLSIVKSIVSLHKGEIKASSIDGHTIFTIKLPLNPVNIQLR